jgi:hypothetical protein
VHGTWVWVDPVNDVVVVGMVQQESAGNPMTGRPYPVPDIRGIRAPSPTGPWSTLHVTELPLTCLVSNASTWMTKEEQLLQLPLGCCFNRRPRDRRWLNGNTERIAALSDSEASAFASECPCWVKRRGTGQAQRRSLSAVDPMATTILQGLE